MPSNEPMNEYVLSSAKGLSLTNAWLCNVAIFAFESAADDIRTFIGGLTNDDLDPETELICTLLSDVCHTLWKVKAKKVVAHDFLVPMAERTFLAVWNQFCVRNFSWLSWQVSRIAKFEAGCVCPTQTPLR